MCLCAGAPLGKQSTPEGQGSASEHSYSGLNSSVATGQLKVSSKEVRANVNLGQFFFCNQLFNNSLKRQACDLHSNKNQQRALIIIKQIHIPESFEFSISNLQQSK